MTKRALAFLFLFPWGVLTTASDEPLPYPEGGIVRVMSRWGMGHACPVSADRLLTAAHVADRGGWHGAVAWSDMAGNEGRAEPLSRGEPRDILALRVTSGRPGVVFPIAKEAPAVDSVVYIVGYSEPTGNILKVKTVQAKVLGRSAGHLFYSKSPGPGSSGSCVLNASREVVAINVGIIEASGHGTGVAVWGAWAVPLEEQ